MKPKRWRVKHVDSEAFHGMSKPMTSVLMNRGLHDPESIESFLNIDLDHLEDPLLLPDMQLAINRVQKAIVHQESIWIYGDYDVDGMTSVAILFHALNHLNAQVHYYIPKRLEEGYGLNSDAIEMLAQRGAKVVITVDCGITAVDEAELAESLGIDLIITDHHECQEELPKAYAVVNPKVPLSHYPYDMLAGAGIALKFAQVILGDAFNPLKDRLLALSAIGTIADIAPLNGENRIIAHFGLKALSSCQLVGIEAILDMCKLKDKAITAGHVGFMIGPRLNAIGRLEHAEDGVALLITRDRQEAYSTALRLDQLNGERQDMEQHILEEAIQLIEKDAIHLISGTIVVWGKDWHTGVVGIVASRLVERFYRPVIVLCEKDGLLKGSARSIPGYSIFEALLSLKNWLEKFGGHEQAAGLTLKTENLPALIEGLTQYNRDHLDASLLVESLSVETHLSAREINHNLLGELSKLEPYGMGNSKPNFVIENLYLEDAKRLGKDSSHLKLILNDHYRIFEGLQFKYGAKSLPFKTRRIDCLVQLEQNTFNGVESIQLMLKDFRSFHPDSTSFTKLLYVHYLSALFRWVILKHGDRKHNYQSFMPLERDRKSLSDLLSSDQQIAVFSYEALLEVAYYCHDHHIDFDKLLNHRIHICPVSSSFGMMSLDLPFCIGETDTFNTTAMKRLDHLETEAITSVLVFDRAHAARLYQHIKKELKLDVHLYLLASDTPVLDMMSFRFFEEAGFISFDGNSLQLLHGQHKKMSFEHSKLCHQIDLLKEDIRKLVQYMKQFREL